VGEITAYTILAIEEVMQFVKKHSMHGIEIKRWVLYGS